MRSLIILLLVFSSSVSARMYQWVDPDSGSTQLSGTPPIWYRSAQGGPRVFVFDNTKVVDDTGIQVSEDERERLRQQAFLMVEEDREQAKEKLLQSKRLKAALDKNRKEEAEEDTDTPEIIELSDNSLAERELAQQEPATIDQMKKLIEDWEQSQTEKAKGLLGE